MLWTQWNAQVELTLLSVLVLAGLGFYDDYAKILSRAAAALRRAETCGANRAGGCSSAFIFGIAGDERTAVFRAKKF
jgi:UDP-N-acetylmuramyl pentapeptide phosphotransferase/UDP-N-acetylglucosamine-1-phosphate transferase